MSPHLSDDNLIDLVYGICDGADHVAGCSQCRDRLRVMQETRAGIVGVPQISARQLALQRQQVLERVRQPRFEWRWIPAPAALALLALALFMLRPASVSQPAPAAVSVEADAVLFQDVYSMEQQVEPQAAAPIRGLFQEASFETSGDDRR